MARPLNMSPAEFTAALGSPPIVVQTLGGHYSIPCGILTLSPKMARDIRGGTLTFPHLRCKIFECYCQLMATGNVSQSIRSILQQADDAATNAQVLNGSLIGPPTPSSAQLALGELVEVMQFCMEQEVPATAYDGLGQQVEALLRMESSILSNGHVLTIFDPRAQQDSKLRAIVVDFMAKGNLMHHMATTRGDFNVPAYAYEAAIGQSPSLRAALDVKLLQMLTQATLGRGRSMNSGQIYTDPWTKRVFTI